MPKPITYAIRPGKDYEQAKRAAETYHDRSKLIPMAAGTSFVVVAFFIIMFGAVSGKPPVESWSLTYTYICALCGLAGASFLHLLIIYTYQRYTKKGAILNVVNRHIGILMEQAAVHREDLLSAYDQQVFDVITTLCGVTSEEQLQADIERVNGQLRQAVVCVRGEVPHSA